MPRAAFPIGRKSFLLLALTVILIGVAWWSQLPPPDPVYQGKRLSEAFFEPHDFGSSHAMRDYFHQFGPAGVTWLTYKLEHGWRPIQPSQPLPFDHAPDWLRRWLPGKWGGLHPHSQIDERMNAANVLATLGPDAASAIPRLVRVLQDRNEEVIGFAAEALNSTGPASWPVVSEALEHGSVSARSALLLAMHRRIHDESEPAPDAEVALAIGALVKACHDPNAKVRCVAIRGIAFCHYRSEIPQLAPARRELIRLFSDGEPTVRLEAVHNCGILIANSALITRLIELLDDPVPELRASSIFLLSKWDRSEKRSATRLRVMLLNDPDSDCRKRANDALKELALSPDEDNANPKLLPAQ